jgi:hypothetical protein
MISASKTRQRCMASRAAARIRGAASRPPP